MPDWQILPPQTELGKSIVAGLREDLRERHREAHEHLMSVDYAELERRVYAAYAKQFGLTIP